MASISSLQIFTSFFIIILCNMCLFTTSTTFNYPAIFNFGDSNSDTGGFCAGRGFTLNPPFGQTFFKKPSGRFSDGRLIIDFLMDAFQLPHLNPVLDSLGSPDFTKGADLAVAGSTIFRGDSTAVSPFWFRVQVAQFLTFKRRSLALSQGKGNKCVPDQNAFEKGLYTFDIGQNDLAGIFRNRTYDEGIAHIPTILAEFEDRVKHLYEGGARLFWIHNTGPIGCLPQMIHNFGTEPSKLDEIGCVKNHNEAAKIFNLQLKAVASRIQALPNANVTLVDVFSIKSDLIANYSKHGFKKATEACCGYGGPPTNYDTKIECGRPGANSCEDPSVYVNWDGIHYTEAANKFVASEILTGKYFITPLAQKGVKHLNHIKRVINKPSSDTTLDEYKLPG